MPTVPNQPQIGGGDGYGSVSGATPRRDPLYSITGFNPTTYNTAITLHQINTNKSNPSLYLPSMSVTAGQTWEFGFRTGVTHTAVAGDMLIRISAEWYNSSNVMISESQSAWVNYVDAYAVDPIDGVTGWRPSHQATVPANAVNVHVVVALQLVNPVNAWAIWNVLYEQV